MGRALLALPGTDMTGLICVSTVAPLVTGGLLGFTIPYVAQASAFIHVARLTLGS